MSEPPPRAQPGAAASLHSEDSTERLIAATPPPDRRPPSPAGPAARKQPPRRALLLLGLTQAALGALLAGGGALAVVQGASLSRVGAGVWAGGVCVVAGVVGALAGLHDCYGRASSGGLVRAFLALSLVSLACANCAAVLAASGLHRDLLRARRPLPTFQEEMVAWRPVLANSAVLAGAALQCAVCLLCVYRAARRVCPCLRPPAPQPDPQPDPQPTRKPALYRLDDERAHRLAHHLDDKLRAPKDVAESGSADSKERLARGWRPAPVLLLPAPPASTLGRVPVSVVVAARPYATLPAPYPPRAHLLYPLPDTRVRRRRSPPRAGRRAEARRGGRGGRGARGSLRRSLERIQRARRTSPRPPSDKDLKLTYTGLDRAYAEQFIAVCDSSRHAAQRHDSLDTTDTTDTTDTAGSNTNTNNTNNTDNSDNKKQHK